jgi:hypothetical protein
VQIQPLAAGTAARQDRGDEGRNAPNPSRRAFWREDLFRRTRHQAARRWNTAPAAATLESSYAVWRDQQIMPRSRSATAPALMHGRRIRGSSAGARGPVSRRLDARHT